MMLRHARISTLLLLLLAGCAQEFTPQRLDERAATNRWMIDTYQHDMARAAIIAQATVYPHHFTAGGSELNELGRRDLHILALHLRDQPGKLNVRRGDTDPALYAARLQTVRDVLARDGVDTAAITLEDAVPGGDGATAERTLRVLKNDTKPLTTDVSTRSPAQGASPSGEGK